MKRWLGAVAVAAAGLIAAGVLGVAGADEHSPKERSLVVGGNATRAVTDRASVAAQDGEYKTALRDAVDDARGKATLLAERAGVGLGPVIELIEQSSGDPDCEEQEEASDRAPSGASGRAAAPGTTAAGPPPRRRRPPSRARAAAARRCYIDATVTVVYRIS